jgi:Cu/Ag efflux pump CusA
MSEKAPSRGDDTRTEQAARAGGVTALSIRRPIGVLSVASVVIVLGLFYLQRLPVDLLPEIAYPEIRVNVNYPAPLQR